MTVENTSIVDAVGTDKETGEYRSVAPVAEARAR
jgi:hypothetical protein